MGVKDYLAVGFAALTVGAQILGDLPRWVGWLGILFCLVMLAISASHIAPRIRKWWNVPLWDALRIAYEKTQGTSMGRKAFAMMEGYPPNVLGFYFRSLVVMHVPLYGMVPPSTVSQRIPSVDLVNLAPQIGVDSLSISAAMRPSYERVTIRRPDIWRAVRAIRKEAAAPLYSLN